MSSDSLVVGARPVETFFWFFAVLPFVRLPSAWLPSHWSREGIERMGHSRHAWMEKKRERPKENRCVNELILHLSEIQLRIWI